MHLRPEIRWRCLQHTYLQHILSSEHAWLALAQVVPIFERKKLQDIPMSSTLAGDSANKTTQQQKITEQRRSNSSQHTALYG